MTCEGRGGGEVMGVSLHSDFKILAYDKRYFNVLSWIMINSTKEKHYHILCSSMRNKANDSYPVEGQKMCYIAMGLRK